MTARELLEAVQHYCLDFPDQIDTDVWVQSDTSTNTAPLLRTEIADGIWLIAETP